MAKQPTSKYSPKMVERIKEVAENHGGLNLELATQIAALPDFAAAGITPRGVVMKCQSLGVTYHKVERKDKAGQAVMQKADMAQAIADLLGIAPVESLAKAEKADLRAVLDALKAEQLVDVAEPETVE